MNRLPMLLIAMFLGAASVQAAQPGVPDLTAVDGAAKQLVAATSAYRIAAQAAVPAGSIVQDAETVYDAAEHFQEEVELGPQDLADDFQTIEQTFATSATEFAAALDLQRSDAVRPTWFAVQDANIALIRAWAAAYGGASLRGYVHCVGSDAAGDTYGVWAASAVEGQMLIVEACRQDSVAGCAVSACKAF